MVTFDMALAELAKKGLIERETPAPPGPRPVNDGTVGAATAH